MKNVMATDQTIHSKKAEQQRTDQCSDCKGKEKWTRIESLLFAKHLIYFISFNPHNHPVFFFFSFFLFLFK